MPNRGDKFAREFFASRLKRLNFRKASHTFSREQPGYTELYEIQGSSWNSDGEPWRFYVNVRVRFSELRRWLELPAHVLITLMAASNESFQQRRLGSIFRPKISSNWYRMSQV
jgi:hypothetical protein